jgi:hypothetical protein
VGVAPSVAVVGVLLMKERRSTVIEELVVVGVSVRTDPDTIGYMNTGVKRVMTVRKINELFRIGMDHIHDKF